MARTHDIFYLSEDRKNNPKEYFKYLANVFESDLNGNTGFEILDVGCATGEFMYYLEERFPNNNYTGIDILPELLEKAHLNNPGGNFLQKNINSDNFDVEKKFDYIFMNGVHSIFESTEPWLGNLLTLRKERGSVYLFGIFNPEELDVVIKSKKSSDTDKWETGWNMFSVATISREIEKYGLSYEIIPWNLPVDIKKNNDPLRSWTIPINREGKKIVINGLQLVHHFYLIKITD